MEKQPLVSISCITYNHALYIRECLDGFLMQECDFDYEILIHDDASTDGTQDIIKEYVEKHPNIIKPIYQTENQYSKGVRGMMARFNFPRAKGKYIALCEGDDYWTDPLKLQKQVDLLEQYPKIDICSHPSFRGYGNEIKKDGYCFWGNEIKIISPKHIIKYYGGTAGLQSIVIRNKNLDKLVELSSGFDGGHSTIQILYSLPNGLVYHPEYMSVYRKNSISSVSKIIFKNDQNYLNRQIQNWKKIDLLNEYTDYKYDKYFKDSLKFRAIEAIGSGNLSLAEILMLVKKYQLMYKLPQLIKSMLYGYFIYKYFK